MTEETKAGKIDETPQASETKDGSVPEGSTKESSTPESESVQITYLHDLSPSPGSKRRKVRVGRGEGGRRGKTAGRGTKGQKARSKTRIGFEGGQMPLARRVPKAKGFHPPFRVEYNVVNVGMLADFEPGTDVTVELLRTHGLARHRGPIKVLGDGEINVALNVSVDAFSATAGTKIRNAGGTITKV